MTVKLSILARIFAIPVILIGLVALIDDLGKYRWFWPYDRDIYGISVLVCLIWYLVFGGQVEAWAKEEQARRDREDELP